MPHEIKVTRRCVSCRENVNIFLKPRTQEERVEVKLFIDVTHSFSRKIVLTLPFFATLTQVVIS